MTAEVAIANAHGIALAADSAVTIGGQKIYNSALKLFSLSKIEPVGVMIYGNASLLGVPWETIIKIFREQLKSRSYKTLEEYGEAFISFLKAQGDYFPQEAQQEWVQSNSTNYFVMMREELLKKIQDIISTAGQVDSAETQRVLNDLIAKHHASLKARDLVCDVTSSFEKEIRKKYLPIFSEGISKAFDNLPIGRTQKKYLLDIATFIHTRAIYPKITSGIVIAGYGKNEIYPSVLTYEIEGFLDGCLKYRILPGKCHKVSSGSDCSITAFAQEDMVNSFMQGLNPSVSTLIEAYLTQVFSRLTEFMNFQKLGAADKSKNEFLLEFSQKSDSLLKDFFAALNQHIQRYHVMPVLSMVRVLPKDELAAMAESLVNLTAFKRRMTDSLETVGGPIDVAVISKGDGLIWVKRKHYFPKELNQHFFRNYFRGIQDD